MIVRVALVLTAAGLAAFALRHPAVPAPPAQDVAAPAPTPPASAPHRARRPTFAPAEILVYVAGAVVRRGLYRLAPGARAVDAIQRAGGLTPSADPAAVNLAARLQDGDEVYAAPSGGRTRAIGAAARSHRSHRRRSAAQPPAGVDVNAAPASDLAAVPGIGSAVAARIVEMRERAGAFASLDELLDVAGMTQTRLERARPYLQPP
ncbi:MAG TPA: ComEA family DNA-binding protein [Candidatus Acidoferrales bacterium]|nr:ComEA family DNA-binding protein [Candidatus Acidoferrales bacterium]